MDGIFITARLKSTRLPGKALIDVNGQPLLAYQIERLRTATDIPIIVCTSTNAQDDPLEAFAADMGCVCFRGNEEDVLDRYLSCAERHDIDRLYIVYADEPFTDTELLTTSFGQMDPLDKIWIRNDAYPDGVFGYGFTRSAMELVNAMKTSEENEVWGEMVSRLPITIVRNTPPYLTSKYSCRLTVDYPEDLEAMKRLMVELGESYRIIGIPALMRVYQSLCLSDINGFRSADYQQRLRDQANITLGLGSE
jgi:spore coat polysaccharide biosynthesis protein SpsF (cytidylyltransferase family)